MDLLLSKLDTGLQGGGVWPARAVFSLLFDRCLGAFFVLFSFETFAKSDADRALLNAAWDRNLCSSVVLFPKSVRTETIVTARIFERRFGAMPVYRTSCKK